MRNRQPTRIIGENPACRRIFPATKLEPIKKVEATKTAMILACPPESARRIVLIAFSPVV
jgi:hypothetical protein